MTKTEETVLPNPPMPTVIVYQNADFVSGLLQEIYQKGMLETVETESTSSTTTGDGESGKVEVTGGGGIKFPSLFSTDVRSTGQYIQKQMENDENMVGNRQKFVFSQAFYLDKVRAELRRRKQVRTVNSVEEAKSIQVGEFIEFEAQFEANEANAILDILTPELTAEVARFSKKLEATKEIDKVSQEFRSKGKSINQQRIDEIQAIHAVKAENQAELTAAVTAAIRADFRGDKTKEFYAIIGDEDDPFTVVTVCEADHFVSKDSDRLLDGRFTVLAKVITGARENVPVLAKNKLLRRIELEALENLLHALTNNGAKAAEKYIDLTFKAKIEGPSITVLPIAIYI